MSRRAQPRLREVRAAYRLLGECIEQGSDANAWRAHLLTGVQNLTGARVALYLHIEEPLSAQEQLTETFASGLMDAQEQALWAHYQATEAHRDAADGPFAASATHLMRLLHHELAGPFASKLVLPGSAEDTSVLPPRLRDVLNGLLAGESEKQIAARLGLSPHTVNRHVQRIYKHYGVSSRSRLLANLQGR